MPQRKHGLYSERNGFYYEAGEGERRQGMIRKETVENR